MLLMGKSTISMAIFKFAKRNKLPEGNMIYLALTLDGTDALAFRHRPPERVFFFGAIIVLSTSTYRFSNTSDITGLTTS